jgi:hypothetical protein
VIEQSERVSLWNWLPVNGKELHWTLSSQVAEMKAKKREIILEIQENNDRDRQFKKSHQIQ